MKWIIHYFLGKQLSDDFRSFEFGDEYKEVEEPAYNLYKLLTTKFRF